MYCNEGMKEMNKPPNNPNNPNGQGFRTNGSGIQPPMETRGQRREMNGPSIDPGLFAGTPLMSNYPKPPAPQIYTQKIPANFSNNSMPVDYRVNSDYDEDDRFSLASSSDSSLTDDSYISNKKSFNIRNQPKKGGRNVKSGGFELNIK